MKNKKIFVFLMSCLFFSCAPKQAEQAPQQIPSPERSAKANCNLSFNKNMSLQETALRAIEIKELCRLSDEQILNLAREALN